jgi:hypothetical protein
MEIEQRPSVPRYKIICRLRDGQYTEELRSDDVPRTAPFSAEEERAFLLLHSFSPETLTRSLCEKEPDGVVVFRTDAVQMAEFDAVMHPAPESPDDEIAEVSA